jgi:predicted phage terminase large subunit-like protein
MRWRPDVATTDNRPLGERLADLSSAERARLLKPFSAHQIRALSRDWKTWARKNQITPEGEWSIWLILAGRGWGKSRCGAEDVAAFGRVTPGARVALVAATFADGRDTMVEGESGLLSILHAEELKGGSVDKAWHRSLGELVLSNRTKYKIYSAEKPNQLRGPQHHRAWCDELAAWKDAEAFDMLMLGLRMGRDPRCVITTTPKPKQIIRDLSDRAADPTDVVLTRGTTYENLANLAPSFERQILKQYEGTSLGEQELNALILSEFPDAYWTRRSIDAHRVKTAPQFERIVVGIDPAATTKPNSDYTGIVAAGRGTDGEFYVLHGDAYKLSPKAWAEKTLSIYDRFGAGRIVAEVNQGGDMIAETIRHIRPDAPITSIHASTGKAVRAEPMAALYEQGRVHHVGTFPRLEDQMCAFPVGTEHEDIVDALVYALSDLQVFEAAGGYGLPPVTVRPSRIWGPRGSKL